MIFNNANNTPDEWVFIDRCAVPNLALYGRALRKNSLSVLHTKK